MKTLTVMGVLAAVLVFGAVNSEAQWVPGGTYYQPYYYNGCSPYDYSYSGYAPYYYGGYSYPYYGPYYYSGPSYGFSFGWGGYGRGGWGHGGGSHHGGGHHH